MERHEHFRGAAAEQYVAETEGFAGTTRGLHRHIRTQAVLELVRRHAPAGGLVADVGCGPAQMAGVLAADGYRYVGIDPAPEMFAQAANELAYLPQVEFRTGDAGSVPLDDASADAMLLVAVIEYLPNEHPWLTEARRVLRPGGVLIFSFPNLLNPAQLLRTLTRPFVAPLVRALPTTAEARRTVYASTAYHHRPFIPWELSAVARRHGFVPRAVGFRGYCMHIRSRPVAPGEVPAHLRREALGRRWVPWIGADVIWAMERT